MSDIKSLPFDLIPDYTIRVPNDEQIVDITGDAIFFKSIIEITSNYRLPIDDFKILITLY